MRSALLLFAVLALTVYGQLVIKGRALFHAQGAAELGKVHYLALMFTDPWVLSSLGAAVLAAGCWMLAIERISLGYAYPFMSLSFVLVPIGAMSLFGEPLPPARLAGLLLIIAGVTFSALAR